jgi:hypothetical protein
MLGKRLVGFMVLVGLCAMPLGCGPNNEEGAMEGSVATPTAASGVQAKQFNDVGKATSSEDAYKRFGPQNASSYPSQ